MNVKWKDSIHDLEVDHEIIPFIMNNDSAEIDNLSKPTGGRQEPCRHPKEPDMRKKSMQIKRIQDEEVDECEYRSISTV